MENYVKTGMIEDYMEQVRYDAEQNYKTAPKGETKPADAVSD